MNKFEDMTRKLLTLIDSIPRQDLPKPPKDTTIIEMTEVEGVWVKKDNHAY